MSDETKALLSAIWKEKAVGLGLGLGLDVVRDRQRHVQVKDHVPPGSA